MKLFKLDIGYGKHINANITESVPSPSPSSSVSGSINSRQMARPSHGHPTLLIYLFHRPSDLVQKLTNRGEYILKGNFCLKINWKFTNASYDSQFPLRRGCFVVLLDRRWIVARPCHSLDNSTMYGRLD